VFWDGGEDGFWEREPFGWEGPGMTGRWTRGIKIGRFGGPAPKEGEKKARVSLFISLRWLICGRSPRDKERLARSGDSSSRSSPRGELERRDSASA
jgi:hypothetical protein